LKRLSPLHWSIGLFVILTSALTLFAWNTSAPFMWQVLTSASDPLGYYQYLPGLFIDGSWDHLGYSYPLENGNSLNLFTTGVAIMQAPFFLLAMGWCKITGGSMTGYELPFVFARLLATSTYTSLGLVLVFAVLRRLYHWTTALGTVVVLLFGTTLYYYTVYSGGMSHTYSFCLMAWGLYLVVRMREKPRGDRLVALFFCAGLLVLIRQLNVLALLVLLFYGTDPIAEMKLRLSWVKDHLRATFVGVVLVIITWLPQLLYWKRITGSWLVFTYGKKDEGFNWADPHLLDVLFSHQNGWFIYTPLMALVMGALLWQAWRNVPGTRTILVVWALVWYVYACWWCWWLGGAFGYRGFVEYYVFLAVPLAALVDTARQGRMFKSIPLIVAFALMIYSNIRLSDLYQYPWEGEAWTWERLGAVYEQAFLE